MGTKPCVVSGRSTPPRRWRDRTPHRWRALPGFFLGTSSFVLTAFFDLLFALMEPLHYRRSPWYQRGFICEALPKVSVILLHDVEDRFRGELSMVLGK